MFADSDTVAAVATAPGRGGVGIIRLSGARARDIGQAICLAELQPRFALFTAFHDEQGVTLDSGLAIFFPCPNSFTGEDVVELHAHGGPVIMDLLLRTVCKLGARQAGPGEFSQRA